MAKKTKRKAKKTQREEAIEVSTISYTAYNTIMSVQLLIEKLVELTAVVKETRSTVSRLESKVESLEQKLDIYLMEEEGGDEDREEEGSSRQDPTPRASESVSDDVVLRKGEYGEDSI